MIKKTTITFLLVFVMISTMKSQDSTKNSLFKNWSISANFGSMLFYGDVKQYDYYPLGSNAKWAISERQAGYGITLNKSLNSTFSIQGQILNGKLSGTQRQDQNYFQAKTLSYSLNAIVNLNNILFRNDKEKKSFFYGKVGIGYADFRSVRRKISTNSPSNDDILLNAISYKNQDGVTKDKKTTEVVIPVGIGFKYKINNTFDAYLESTINYVNTDKLDANVKVGSTKDRYQYSCIGITYHIGKKQTPIEWENPLISEGLASRQDKNLKVDSSLYKQLDSLRNKLVELDKSLAEQNKASEELDSDGDGVIDKNDLEPDSKAGALVNFQGKTITINSAAVAENQAVTAASTPNFAAGNQPLISVFFSLGSAAIDANAIERIAVAAKLMKSDASLKLLLEGNADKVGSKEINDKLSEARAIAVKNDLVKNFGIDANRITVTFKGNSAPLSNLDRINRRVDFMITR